jgi:hypothetical protein
LRQRCDVVLEPLQPLPRGGSRVRVVRGGRRRVWVVWLDAADCVLPVGFAISWQAELARTVPLTLVR